MKFRLRDVIFISGVVEVGLYSSSKSTDLRRLLYTGSS